MTDDDLPPFPPLMPTRIAARYCGFRKPFRRVLRALDWTVEITPKGMRRTFDDLARQAQVHDVVTRAISGHQTDRMQRLYSTAQREEMREAVGKVISLATARNRRKAQSRDGP